MECGGGWDTPLVRFLSPAHRQSRNTQGNEARPTLTKPANRAPPSSYNINLSTQAENWDAMGVAGEEWRRTAAFNTRQNFLARASHQRCQSSGVDTSPISLSRCGLFDVPCSIGSCSYVHIGRRVGRRQSFNDVARPLLVQPFVVNWREG